jgi:prepilin-type N-terminal cleavage/methylation domain-containing protein
MIKNRILQKGFTLIELLIVIAVLGVLAATLLVVVNPIEQLARGEDSGRKSSVAQLGRSLQAYYTANDSTYPSVAGTPSWDQRLITSGEIKTFPTNPSGVTAPCTGGTAVNNYCYKANAIDAIVYTRLESSNERNKGTCAGNSANTWYVWSSAAGKAGLYCSALEPAPGLTGGSLL